MAEQRESMDARPGGSDSANDSQPWLAYAEANGMMHTFENVGRSASLSNILASARVHHQHLEQHADHHEHQEEPVWPSRFSTGGMVSDNSSSPESARDSGSSYSTGSNNTGAMFEGSLSRRSAFLNTIDPAIRRKVEAAQVYFLEFYVDQLTYIANRRLRLDNFKAAMRSVPVSAQEVQISWHNHQANETNILRRRRNRTREHEFDILSQIGQGGFGQVFLARKRDTGEVCALKKMDKRLLIRLNEVQHILTERDILRTSRSPWLVRLLYSFQDPRHLYLAMEFVPGGDIRSLLIHSELFRHPVARFYIAEAIVSVCALHSFGYFHRDLKPENFLVDTSGHVKLTDFGLSHGHLSRPTLEAMRRKLDKVKDKEF
ncbi:serine/threonine-protein kinase dbf2, partial [Coemansia erecta]